MLYRPKKIKAVPPLMRLFFPTFVIFALLTAACAQDEKPVKAPTFPSDARWIDIGAAGQKVPHTIEGYRGHVLLIDFWEYTCINCIRDFRVVKRWYAKYHADGFDVVGVHYGEFEMGFSENNVRDAAKRFHLPWPVIADINGSIWRAYDSDVWPNRYLINQNGNIVLHVEGEGNNQPMEQKIRQLLAATHPEVNKIPLDPPEDTFAPSCGIPTEETYVGDWFGRGSIANPKAYDHDDKASEFHSKGAPTDGQVMLSGQWITRQDGVTSDDPHGEAQLRYHARSVYAVLSAENSKKPVRVYLLQDGKPLDRNEAAIDVQFDSHGSYLEVGSPRMYYLVKNRAFGSHLLVLEPQASGFGLHSLTYGNNCQQNFQPM
jgi:thiol-disulfide isomerase/thioredoxin